MPKNTTGGNKAKKGKNNPSVNVPKELIYADKSGYQFYAVIEQFMGHSAKLIMQFESVDDKGNRKTDIKHVDGVVRGKIMKKCKPKKGDVLLVCTRDFSTKFVDIIHKYTEDNVKDLKKNYLFIDEFLKKIDALHTIDNKSNTKHQEEDDGNIYFDEEFEPQNRNYELESSSESEHDA
jgi:initiation factor 1A